MRLFGKSVAKKGFFGYLLMWLFVDNVFLQIYFNRKGRKGLRKGRKVFKKICESVAKKTRIMICNVCS